MQNLIPWIIMSFREWLEAFLIIAIILKFLEKTWNKHLKNNVFYWTIASILTSTLLGYILFWIGKSLKNVDAVSEIWTSILSLIAVWLVTTFIVWMIQHWNKIKWYIEDKTAKDLSRLWIFIVSFVMIVREWVEVAIFAFAWEYHYLSIIIWVSISAILTLIIYLSLIKINITAIFKITLIYLIIQAGYLLGYWIHEGLWSLHTLWYLSSDNILLIKLYDLSSSIFNHKEWLIGLPLNVLIGWYSKPEWIQFIVQYIFTIAVFIYWYKHSKLKNS